MLPTSTTLKRGRQFMNVSTGEKVLSASAVASVYLSIKRTKSMYLGAYVWISNL